MKFRRLIVASLTSLIASAPAASLLEACEQCREKTCRSCSAADDHGLLDLLDAASHRLQPRLPRVNMPRVPSLDTALKFAWGGRSAANCGCEIREASCGCELHQPTCGCESPTSCHCQNHARSGSGWEYAQPQQHRHQSEKIATPPQHTAPKHIEPQPEMLPVPEVAPRSRSRGSTPTSVPRTNHPSPTALPQALPQARPQTQSQPHAPSRIPVPVPTPLPDSQVDPFRDDTATRVRKVPSRTIEYRQAAPTYRQNYDPQASTGGGAHLRLSDDDAPATNRSGLAENSSSRSRTSPAAQPGSQVNPPSVVTASGRSLPSYDRQPSQPDATGPANPLRRN